MLRLLQWCFARRARACIADSLGEVGRRLRETSHDTEADFLKIGAALEVILNGAKEEAEALAGVAEAGSGERGDRLLGVLDSVVDWARNADRVSECGNSLAGLLPSALAVRTPLNELKNLARVLSTMSVLTRIESGRIGTQASNFETLGREVSRMAVRIDEKAEEILRVVECVVQLASRAQSATAMVATAKHADLIRMATESEQGIDALQRERNSLTVAANEARSRWQSVLSEIREVVLSLQAHDATRQRLEHVEAALTQLAVDRTVRKPDAMCAVIQLQRAQLSEACDAFQTGVAELRTRMDRVAKSFQGFSHLAHQLTADQGGGGPADSIEGHFAALVAAIEAWNASRGVMTATSAEVRRFCKQVEGFIAEIEGVGVQTLWLALNAEIQAVHLDESGTVMQSVAEGIRRLTNDVSTHAICTAKTLGHVNATAGLAATALSEADLQDPDEAAAAVRQTATEVAAANLQCRRSLGGVAGAAEGLAREIAALAQSVQADQKMAATVSYCLQQLHDAQTAVENISGSRSVGSTESFVTQFRSSYTMEAERGVHTAVTGVGSPSADIAEPPAEREFEGDVELF